MMGVGKVKNKCDCIKKLQNNEFTVTIVDNSLYYNKLDIADFLGLVCHQQGKSVWCCLINDESITLYFCTNGFFTTIWGGTK